MFRFELRDLETIRPWGPATAPSLSWFGLSDGWYWLRLGDQEVLHTAEAPAAGPPYLDYQVVRLWEDLLELLPYALTELPADVASLLRVEDEWLTRVEHLERELLDDDRKALRFWWMRKLDLGHLAAPPRVWFWRDGEDLRVLWRPAQEDRGHWVATSGSLTMSVATFLEDVRSFDRAFLAAMQERVDAVLKVGGIPGVAIDLAHLEHEQLDRASWLDNALSRPAPAEDWDTIRRILVR